VSTDDLRPVADRLDVIAEELAEVALERLRRATSESELDGAPSPENVAEERRVTRARRAVEKAAALLRGGSDESTD
jgi:hypothetical protein